MIKNDLFILELDKHLRYQAKIKKACVDICLRH